MITVHFFAAARDAAGVAQSVMDAPETIEELQTALAAHFPGTTAAGTSLADVLARCTFLVDGAKATEGTPLTGAARVDVLPPFAGG